MARCDMAPDYNIDPNHVDISHGSGSRLADCGVWEELQSILDRSMEEGDENLKHQ